MRLRHPAVPVLAAAFALALATAPAARADTGFTATLSGAQEVPPTPSGGFGTGTFVLNNAQTQLTFNITYSGLSIAASAAHIHGAAPPGVNAGVLFNLGPFGTFGTSGSFNGVWAIPAAQVPNLINGLLYVNIHTTNFPGGEIRGQIVLDGTSAKSTTWSRVKRLYGAR